MLKAKGKLLKSIREKQLVQWNHRKINSLLLIQNNGSQSAGRKIKKRHVHFDCGERKTPPPKKIPGNGLHRYWEFSGKSRKNVEELPQQSHAGKIQISVVK